MQSGDIELLVGIRSLDLDQASRSPRSPLVSQNSPANSPTPANGTVGASAPLRLADEASDEKLVEVQHSRCNSKLVALHRDAQHRLLDRFIGHPLGQEASFFGSLLLIFGVVDIRCNGHGTRPFADRERPQGSFHDDAPRGVTRRRGRCCRAGGLKWSSCPCLIRGSSTVCFLEIRALI